MRHLQRRVVSLGRHGGAGLGLPGGPARRCSFSRSRCTPPFDCVAAAAATVINPPSTLPAPLQEAGCRTDLFMHKRSRGLEGVMEGWFRGRQLPMEQLYDDQAQVGGRLWRRSAPAAEPALRA